MARRERKALPAGVARQGGGTASKIGRQNEKTLQTYMEQDGYSKISPWDERRLREAVKQGVDPADFCKRGGLDWVFATRMRLFPNLYGIPWVNDAFLYRADAWEGRGLLVEVKSQELGGSVDEKLPFVMLSLDALMRPTAAVIIGNGFREGAVTWAMKFAQNSHHGFVRTFRRWDAFRRYSKEGFVDAEPVKLYAPDPQRRLFG